MADIKQQVDELNAMLLQGQMKEAFDQFYDENVTMQENFEEPCQGKEANQKRHDKWDKMVKEIHGMELINASYGDDFSVCEWTMDVTFKETGRSQGSQYAIQKWKDGKIIHEQFIYPKM